MTSLMRRAVNMVKPLSEYTDRELYDELTRRDAIRMTGRCSYCERGELFCSDRPCKFSLSKHAGYEEGKGDGKEGEESKE